MNMYAMSCIPIVLVHIYIIFWSVQFCKLHVGISVVSLGVDMGASWHRCSTSTSEPFWRGLGAVALGGLPRSASELIGEDSLGNH